MDFSDFSKRSFLNTGEKSACCGCRACEQICPVGCISMTLHEDGFFYPEVDRSQCVRCGKCELVCPYNREDYFQNVESTNAFSLTNKNDEILLKSSSGGVFYEIAHKAIEQGGVVYGAILDKNFICRHTSAIYSHDLIMFLTSKYIQSNTDGCFKQALNDLKAGKRVLFSGTPCQIAGLKGFLGRDYENLLCIDVACHGVPSQREFTLFVSELEKKYGGTVSNISFRDKSTGVWRHSFSFYLLKGSKRKKRILAPYRVPYYCFFLLGMNLRESCYHCPFACLNRTGDITLADFWQVEKVLPQAYHKKGTSAVLINSEKGLAALQNVSECFTIHSTNLKDMVKYNHPFQRPCTRPPSKEFLEKAIFSSGCYHAYKCFISYSYRIKEFCKYHMPNRLKSALRKITKR